MGRWVAMAVVVAGWVLLAAAVVAPLAGIAVGLARPGQASGYVYGVPGPGALLVRSVTLSAVATVGAVLLGLMPAAVLGSARGRRLAVVMGLVLAPLLIPPQVYVYAWQIAIAPQALLGKLVRSAGEPWLGGAVKAGLISAAWLWPVVTLIVAAGWRSAGQAVYAMAMLDTTPRRAFFRAVLPSLRAHVLAAACLVFAATLIEYAIPHLSLVNVHSTVLQLLVDAGAPPRQILVTAGQSFGIVCALVGLAAWSLRDLRRWQPADGDEVNEVAGRSLGWAVWLGSAATWIVTVCVPAGVMLAWLRVPGAWREGFALFGRVWIVSLMVAGAAAAGVLLVTATTVLLRAATQSRTSRAILGVVLVAIVAVALIPPAAMGRGFTLTYNRLMPWQGLVPPDFEENAPPWAVGLVAALVDPYAQSPLVWIAGLVARYAAVGSLIAWLAWGRRGHVLVEQARADGAGTLSVLVRVVIPAVWPSLMAAGMIVMVLALFEVMVTQALSPPAFPAIGMSILNQMHYGRDDVVITTSLMVMVAGILLTQACGWLLVWRRS